MVVRMATQEVWEYLIAMNACGAVNLRANRKRRRLSRCDDVLNVYGKDNETAPINVEWPSIHLVHIVTAHLWELRWRDESFGMK